MRIPLARFKLVAAMALRFINRARRGRVGRKLVARVGRSLLPHGTVLRDVVVGNGFRMTLHTHDYLDSEVYFDAFEHTTSEVLRAVLRPGDCFADAGANIGFFTLTAARLVGPHGRVVAFEPGAAARERLHAACHVNGCERIVDVRDYGLADGSRSTVLFIPTSGCALASLQQRASLGECVPQPVELRRFDDVWNGKERVRCLKVDVEGAELQVLHGARETLRRWRPHVICEVNSETAAGFGHSPIEIVDYMRRDVGGYRVHALTSRGIRYDVAGPCVLEVPRLENWWFEPD